MPSIDEIRQQFPQYGDMSDQQLADALYAKHYSDMPREEFNAKLGAQQAATPAVPAVEQAVYKDPRISEGSRAPEGVLPAPPETTQADALSLGLVGRGAFRPSSKPSSALERAAGQGGARSVADVVGFGPDLVNMALNVPLAVTDTISKKLGGPDVNYRLPLLSDKLAEGASSIAESVGIPVVDPDKMSLAERVAYNAARFGSQGALGGAALAKAGAGRAAQIAATPRATPRVFDPLLKPYADRPVAAIAGDTVAGAGAGTGLVASQSLPESVRDTGGGAVGGVADLLAMLAGGVSGGTLATVATNGPGALTRKITSHLPDRSVPYDDAGNPTTRRDADRASVFLKDQVVLPPEQAAANIRSAQADFTSEGLPVPSSGLISGDTGLENVERGMRVKNPTPFQEKDRALHEAARGEVKGIGPETADPRDFTNAVEDVAKNKIDEARVGVDRAQTYEARVDEVRQRDAAKLEGYRGRRKDDAGLAVDETVTDKSFFPAREKKNVDFDTAPGRNEQLPIEEVSAAAQRVRERNNELRPDNQMPEEFMRRLDNLAPDIQQHTTTSALTDEFGRPITRTTEVNEGGPGTARGGDLADTRKYLSVAMEKARQAGNFDLASAIGTLRGAINRTIEEAPGYAEANAGYRQFADTYRPGPGDEMAVFTRELDRDPTRSKTPPSATAPRFLKEGQPEKAAALRRGIDASEEPGRGTNAAGDFITGQMVEANVVKNGRIDSNAMRRWLEDNDSVLRAFPEARTRLNDAHTRAQRGEISAERFAEELRSAQAGMRNTEDEVYRGAFKYVTGRNPENAVRDIFGSGDPERNMTAIKAQLKGNAKAEDALKRSVADWIYRKISDIKPGAVNDGNDAVNFARLTKTIRDHEKTMVAAGFSPDEMNAMRRAQKLLEPLAKRSGQATVGSPTAENTELGWRVFEIAMKTWYGGLRGGNVSRNARLARGLVGGTEPDAAAVLAVRAMTDPELAATLLTRNVSEAGSPAWNARLAKLLRRTEALKQTLSDEDTPFLP